MGHIRLNELPDLERWRRIVAKIAENGSVAEIADSTMQAATKGLELARNDRGLVRAVLLLVQTVQAAREKNFAAALTRAGITTAAKPGIFDVVAGFSEAMDAHLQKSGGRTDITEMAQLAATECLTSQLSTRSASLFGTTTEEVRRAAKELSTDRGFATLAHDFFSRFTQRFLTYHLGRELSLHVGGNGRFADTAAHTDFVASLERHCREAAIIVRNFSGGWYSKQNFLGGITPEKTRRFVNYSLTKLRQELRIRGERDAE